MSGSHLQLERNARILIMKPAPCGLFHAQTFTRPSLQPADDHAEPREAETGKCSAGATPSPVSGS